MLQSAKLQKRQSEIRQELATLAGKDSPTDDETRSMADLDKEYGQNEQRYRAALIAEDETRQEAKGELETRSDREYAALVDKFELRQVALALDEGAALSGQTAEIVQELRSQGGYRGVPVPYAALEQRAGETIASGGTTPEMTRPIIERLFPQSVAARMGVQSVNITQGDVVFPVATSGAVTGWQATETGDVGGPSPFAVDEPALAPDQTLGCQMVITRKALKQSGAGLEAAIRRDMNAAIGAELDNAVFYGSGSAGEPLGIVTGAATYGITSTDGAAAALDWATLRAEIVEFLNGNTANSPGSVRIGWGADLWSALEGLIFDAGSGVTELDRMMKTVPAGNVVTSSQFTSGDVVMTTNAGGVAPAFVGLWGAVDMIRDPYSLAGSGALKLTGLVTADVQVARAAQTRVLTNFA